jgi:ACS family glucarate transporter-like MFS transporter
VSALADRGSEPTAGPISHVRWRIVALLTLSSFVAYVLRQNMSVAGRQMIGDLGITDVQLGIILAAFAWGYALFQLPGGIVGHWVGGRRGLTLIMVLWGALNMLVGLVPRAASPVVIIGSLAALRFLMGATQAPLYPIMSGFTIARWFPATGWALPNGLANAGLTFGSAATGPLIAWLTVAIGWRGSFVVTGPLAFVVAALWWWYARDRPEEHHGVRPGELARINRGRAPEAAGKGEALDWRRLLGNRNLLLITLSYFFANYLFYFFFNWLYIYLVDVRKFTLLSGGAFAAAPWITGAVGAVAGGIVCDRLSPRYGTIRACGVVSMIGLGLAGVFLVAAGAVPSPYVAVVLLSLCLAGQQFTDSAAWAATTLVGGRQASAACGVLNTGGNVVGGIGALLVPITARELGWPAALGTAALSAFLGAAVWIWIRAEVPPSASRG